MLEIIVGGTIVALYYFNMRKNQERKIREQAEFLKQNHDV